MDNKKEKQPSLFDEKSKTEAKAPDKQFLEQLDKAMEENGPLKEDERFSGSVGRNMFDLPNSKDNLVSVIIPLERIHEIPIQSLVRIKSLQDNRIYQGIVVGGPFYEPDNLRADSPILVTSNIRGGTFMPRFHGRALVEITGEEINGKVVVPRFRPIPNNPVFVLSSQETSTALKIGGDIEIGLSLGHDDISVSIPSDKKFVLPRHLGILGTTGGGKSTTVSGLISEFQKSNIATILIDTEGEYTHIDQPTEDEGMLNSLKFRNKSPKGVANTNLLYLIGRESTNPSHTRIREFCLKFENLSPYAVMEILELSDAQQDCFRKAYDIAYEVLKQLKIFPTNAEEEKEVLELDEFDRGIPKLTLQMMYDIVRACAEQREDNLLNDEGKLSFFVQPALFKEQGKFIQIIKAAKIQGDKRSWRKLQGRLGSLSRYGIFDSQKVQSFDYDSLTKPGNVSIIDLSDTDSPQINNLVIAELLRGLMNKQNETYKESQKDLSKLRKVMVIIEEAHEFLSSSRIKEMPELYQQVARIAKRGRKRWLGLAFVTQLPQHLPDEVLGLINNFILHKISDAGVISRLKKSLGNLDESLWDRVPNLAPGQAVVSFSSWSRPLLVAINPAPCKLLMID